MYAFHIQLNINLPSKIQLKLDAIALSDDWYLKSFEQRAEKWDLGTTLCACASPRVRDASPCFLTP